MNGTMPDREAYELRISLLEQQGKKIKRHKPYREFLIDQWKEIQSSGSLDTDDLIRLTIKHLEDLNDL